MSPVSGCQAMSLQTENFNSAWFLWVTGPLGFGLKRFVFFCFPDDLRKAGNYCTCPNPCAEKRYVPTLTFAAISSDSDTADAAQQELNKGYAAKLTEAREIRYRINEDNFRETMKMFFSIFTQHTNMHSFLLHAEDKIRGQTKGIDAITTLLRKDCQLLNTKQHQVVKILRDDVRHEMDNFQSHLRQLHPALEELLWVWTESKDLVSNSVDQEAEEAQFRRLNETIWAHMSTLPAMLHVLKTRLFASALGAVQAMTQDADYRLLDSRMMSIDEQASAWCNWCLTSSSLNQTVTHIVQQRLQTYLQTNLSFHITNAQSIFSRLYSEYISGSTIPEAPLVCFCPNTTMETTTATPTTTESSQWESRIRFNWTTIQGDIEELVAMTEAMVNTAREELTEPLETSADYVAELLQLIAPKCNGELQKLYHEYADSQQRILDAIQQLKSVLIDRNNTYNIHMDNYEQVLTTLTALAKTSDLDSFMAYVKDEVINAESLLLDMRFSELRLEQHIGHAQFWFLAQFDDAYVKQNSVYWSFFRLDTPQLLDTTSSYIDVKTSPVLTDPDIVNWWHKSKQTIDNIISELVRTSDSVSVFGLSSQ